VRYPHGSSPKFESPPPLSTEGPFGFTHYNAYAQYSPREYKHINLVTTVTSKIHSSKIQRPFSLKVVIHPNVRQLGKHESESSVTPKQQRSIPEGRHLPVVNWTEQENPAVCPRRATVTILVNRAFTDPLYYWLTPRFTPILHVLPRQIW